MEQKTYDVFISYSRKDYVDEHNNVIPENEVSKIKEALTKAKITYWFDEEGVYAGDKFAKVIVRNIKASSIFVFLSTKDSNQSEWTANEISTAHMLGKKIIPVRIDDSVFHDDVILYIARLSRIDYFSNPDEGRRELVRSIKEYLEDVKAAEAQKAVDEQRRKEELVRQRRQQEEEKKRQARIEKIETEIAALETQRTERKKAVLQKEQELKLAQVDLDACEAKIKKLQDKLQELRDPKKKVEAERRIEEADAKERVFTVGKASFKMVRVEGGSMGTFYIGETQVTQALWQAVMGDNPSRFEGPDHPVECVSWNDCQSFVEKLNEELKKDLNGCLFRLPKEAEWEYAALGGNKSKGYSYAGCDDIDKVAWYWKNSGDNYLKGSDDDWDWDEIKKNNCKTHPVKKLSPNELGIYDMSGNVWEWCEDLYEPSSSRRVLRGGSWFSDAGSCRVSYRGFSDPAYGDDSIGFRLVLPQ